MPHRPDNHRAGEANSEPRTSPAVVPGAIRRLSRLVTVAMLGGLAFLVAPARAQTPAPESAGRIVVWTELDYPPYSFLGEKGRPAGLNVDVARAIGRVMGMEVDVRIGPWAEIRKKLEQGKIDAIAGMYYSEDRDKLSDFSTPYRIVHHAIFARKDAPPIKSEYDLRGKQIIVVRGDIMHDYVLERGLSTNPVLVGTQAEALRLLASGKCDYALAAKLPGLFWVKQLKLSNVKDVGPIMRPSRYCFAVAQGNAMLLGRFNEGLAILEQSGQYAEIEDKWLGPLEPQRISVGVVVKYAAMVLLPLLALLAGFVVWSQTLRRQVVQRTRELQEDIAERKKVEASLRTSEARYRSYIEATGQLAWTVKANGEADDVPAWRKFTGQTVEQVKGWGRLAALHPDDIERIRQTWAKSLATKSGYEAEYRIRRHDGVYLDFLSRGVPVLNDDGRLREWVGTCIDITERKRAEERVQHVNHLLRTISDVNLLSAREEDPLALIQKICKLLVETQAADAALAVLTDEAERPDTCAEAGLGKSFQLLAARLKQGVWPACCEGARRHEGLHIVSERGQACAGCPVAAVWPQHEALSIRLAHGEKTYGYLTMVVQHAREFDDEAQSLCVEVAGDVATALRGIEQDVQRKRAEERLLESNRELREALQKLRDVQEQLVRRERLSAVGQMASGIAHDFSNALMPVLGYADLLLSAPDVLNNREQTVETLKLVRIGAMNAAETVRRLQDFYRPADPSRVAPVDLAALILTTVALTRPKWEEQVKARGITIAVRAEIASTPPIMGDEHELSRLLTNFIFNAVDAMPKGGSIVVRLHPDAAGQHAVLAVQDTGTGMSEEVRRKCLEPFFTTKGGRGVGLGLAVTYGILERHNGSIEVQSELGQGTTMIVRLPLKDAAAGSGGPVAPAAAPSQPPPDPPSAGPGGPPAPSLRVLFVDDEEAARHLLRRYLEADGHTVQLAADGPECLASFRAGRFDVVILDRTIPGTSGDELAAAIKAISAETPVIMLTGFGDAMLERGEQPAGVDAVVAKPSTREALRRAITEVMAGKRSTLAPLV